MPSIATIFEDKHGILWIILKDNGYFIFDRQNDVFKRPKSDNAEMVKVSMANPGKFVYDKINDVGWNLSYIGSASTLVYGIIGFTPWNC